MTDIKTALHQALTQLKTSSPSARLDTEVLLAYVLNKPRTFLYTYPEKQLLDSQYNIYQQLITKRVEGQPIAHLTGTREFWSIPLLVSQDTLIPRPETELLIELALTHLANKPQALVLDLGTGSGAIALALATEHPDWQLTACDSSPEAINIARENAKRLGLLNLTIYESDWFANLPEQRFDAILSNPPYIAECDPHLTQGDVRFEPRQALVSGPDGLEALRQIIEQSHQRLVPGGFLLLEHGYNQKHDVTSLLQQHGYKNVQCWPDCQGNDRVSGGWR